MVPGYVEGCSFSEDVEELSGNKVKPSCVIFPLEGCALDTLKGHYVGVCCL